MLLLFLLESLGFCKYGAKFEKMRLNKEEWEDIVPDMFTVQDKKERNQYSIFECIQIRGEKGQGADSGNLEVI